MLPTAFFPPSPLIEIYYPSGVASSFPYSSTCFPPLLFSSPTPPPTQNTPMSLSPPLQKSESPNFVRLYFDYDDIHNRRVLLRSLLGSGIVIIADSSVQILEILLNFANRLTPATTALFREKDHQLEKISLCLIGYEDLHRFLVLWKWYHQSHSLEAVVREIAIQAI
ncbi:unnamed protein product [Lactuca saligna]|uniref:Uncharacterized protein n=1 Tax=Lactuca saligna TaxID=75948 RepID=A0AA35YIK9_LACSI|nr:unnamed protein product [Lactuca saligna]